MNRRRNPTKRLAGRRQLVRELFDRAATTIARDAAPVLAPLHDDFVRFAAPRPDDIALDLGSGTGGVTRRLAGQVRHVTGLDLSRQSLRQLITNTPPSLHAVCGDLHDLPFRAGAFSLITASFALNASLPFDSLPAIRRVLMTDGRFALQEWGPADALSRAVDALLRTHATPTPPAPLAALREGLALFPPVWDRYLQDVEDYVEWLEAGGWRVETAEETAPVDVIVPSVAAMTRFLLARPDRRAEYEALSPPARAAFDAALRQIVAQAARPDGSLRWEPVLFRVRAVAGGTSG